MTPPKRDLLFPAECAGRLRLPKLPFNFVLLLISAVAFFAPPAHGQAYQSCPDPWYSADKIYGTFSVQGGGSTDLGDGSSSAQETVSGGWVLTATVAPCLWGLSNGIAGTVIASVSNEVQLTCTGNGQSTNVQLNSAASGIATPSADDEVAFNIPDSTYFLSIAGSINVTSPTVEGPYPCPTVPITAPFAYGPADTGLIDLGTEHGFPVKGNILSFSLTDNSPTSSFPNGFGSNANWDISWSFSPVPDEDCKPCKDHRGSELGVQSQSLGENIPIVGTPYYLHYGSDRTAGHAGADAVAIADALSLGGWTLNVHHAMEPLLLAWCAGGLCTPYAVVPKALFLGDGSTRNDSDVQAPVSANGNLYLTSEDGSEVYEFKNYIHMRTLRPMTGAVLYSFAYDANGHLIKVTDANGNVTTIRRDAKEHPTAIVSPYGQTTKLIVDANGYLSEVTDPAGHTTKLTSGATGLLGSFTDANGNTYKFTYDDYGRALNDSDSAGGSLTLARADTGNGYIVTEETALGVNSKFQSDFIQAGFSSNQQFANTWPDGLVATEDDVQTLGQLGEITTLPDGSSSNSTLAPDPRWGIQVPITATETLKQGTLKMKIAETRNAQLGNGGDVFDLTSQTDQETINGRTYNSVFTGSDRTYVDTTPEGRRLTTVLDSQERIAGIQPEGLLARNFDYDARGRLSTVTQGTRTTSFSYNNDGFLASVTDPLGLETKFTYDADGRPLSSTLADGRVIGFKYDPNGNLTSVTPPGKSAHEMQYTPVNLLSEYAPPAVSGTGPTAYTYDADRDLTKITRADGKTVAFGYDAAGRLNSIATPTQTIDYTYDAKTGNLDSEKSTGGENLAYSYNGPLPISTEWAGSIGGTVDVTYDGNFWITSESVNGGETSEFAYDKDGLLTQAGELSVENSAEYGLVIGTALNEAKDTYAYDSYGELTGYRATFGAVDLYSVLYTRDADGRVAGKTETIGGNTTTYTYTYDPSDRLVAVGENGKTASTYTYDSNSNRLKAVTASGTASGTYDAQDRLLTYGKSSFTYTANGELESEKTGTQITNYVYDVLGNLTGVTLSGGKSIEYLVDPENRRVGMKVNGALMQGFLYDGDRIVAQLDSSNKIVSRFVYATGRTSPDYMISGGETYRIFSDQLGSPRVIVNAATGAIAEEITYDEFGNVISDTKPGFQPFGFAGGLYDQDTKLVRFGARDYNPQTGRWTAKDPILFAGDDANLYAYALNDPVNLWDPSGLQSAGFGLQSPFSGPNPFQALPPQLLPPDSPPGWLPGASQGITSSPNWWVNMQWSDSNTVPRWVPKIGGCSLKKLILKIPGPNSPPYSNPDSKNRFQNWLTDLYGRSSPTGPFNLPGLSF